jgi:tetratricopeptide (TPR) repeat protein
MRKKIIPFVFGLSVLTCVNPSVQAANFKFKYEQKSDDLYAQQSHHQREQDYIGYRRREELLRQQREENDRIGLLASEFARKKDYIGLGSLYYSNGYLRYAINAYTMAIEANPRSPAGYFGRAIIKRDRKDFAGALADFDRSIEIEPDNNAGSYYNRALVKKDMGNRSGAIQDFRRAAQFYRSAGNLASLQKSIDHIQRLGATE